MVSSPESLGVCRSGWFHCVCQLGVGLSGTRRDWGTRGDSDIIFLVFVFLALAGRFGGSGWLFLNHRAVALRRVTDVVPALVHLVGTFIPVTVFVHGIEEDEDAEGCCRHDADHHASGAAGLPDDLHCSRRAPFTRAGGVSCGQIVEIGGRGYTWVFKPV